MAVFVTRIIANLAKDSSADWAEPHDSPACGLREHGETRLKLFHLTSADAARSILRSGFKDGTESYMTDQQHTGVWFSDIPDPQHGPGVLLEVDFALTEQELTQYEWVEEGSHIREFLIPAAVVNSKAVARIAGHASG